MCPAFGSRGRASACGTALFFALLLAAGSPAAGNVHTVFTTECGNYFTWQALGMVYSHKKSGQPGKITRLMSCTDEQWASYPDKDLVPTHRVRSYPGTLPSVHVTAACSPSMDRASTAQQEQRGGVGVGMNGIPRPSPPASDLLWVSAAAGPKYSPHPGCPQGLFSCEGTERMTDPQGLLSCPEDLPTLSCICPGCRAHVY